MRIAVTGHRTLTEPARVAADVDTVLGVIARLYPKRRLMVLSALAEGADRLVAERALARGDAGLVAVVPMPDEEYERSFATPASVDEYRRLRDRAEEVVTLPPAGSPEAAYARLGEWLVEQCDDLITVWDGKDARGPGGTAEVVDLASRQGMRVFRIHPGGEAP